MCFKAFGHDCKKLQGSEGSNLNWMHSSGSVQVQKICMRFRFRFRKKVVWTGLNWTSAMLGWWWWVVDRTVVGPPPQSTQMVGHCKCGWPRHWKDEGGGYEVTSECQWWRMMTNYATVLSTSNSTQQTSRCSWCSRWLWMTFEPLLSGNQVSTMYYAFNCSICCGCIVST